MGDCEQIPQPSTQPHVTANEEEARQIEAALARNRPRILRCYEEAALVWWANDHPIVSQLEIDPRGHVTSVRVLEDNREHPAIGCCVRRELLGTALPAFGKPVSHVHRESCSCRGSSSRFEREKPIVRGIVSAHQQELHACYRSVAARFGAFQLDLDITFTIAPDGSVPLARGSDVDVIQKQLSCCVTKLVRSWRLPPLESSTPIVYGYRLYF